MGRRLRVCRSIIRSPGRRIMYRCILPAVVVWGFRWASFRRAGSRLREWDPRRCRAAERGFAMIPSTSRGHRAAFARSLVAALIGISFTMPLSLSARTCSVCDGRFSHRIGPFSVHLATAKSLYRIGEPIPVRVSITNHSRNSLALDTSAPVSELALHIASPHTNFVQF